MEFKFGDKVDLGGVEMTVLETVPAKQRKSRTLGVRVINMSLSEMTADQQREWSTPAKPGEFKFMPGIVVDAYVFAKV